MAVHSLVLVRRLYTVGDTRCRFLTEVVVEVALVAELEAVELRSSGPGLRWCSSTAEHLPLDKVLAWMELVELAQRSLVPSLRWCSNTGELLRTGKV